MERVWETMEDRDRRNIGLPTSPNGLQEYLDCLDRDCVRYHICTNVNGEPMVVISDTYWGVGEYDCTTVRTMAETKFPQEVKQ